MIKVQLLLYYYYNQVYNFLQIIIYERLNLIVLKVKPQLTHLNIVLVDFLLNFLLDFLTVLIAFILFTRIFYFLN